MAKASTPVPSPEGYAVLKFGGRCIVLPAETASDVFRLLCQGEVVEFDWNSRAYKRVADHEAAPSLQTFSTVQYAQLALESDS